MNHLTIPQYLIETSVCLIAFYLLYVLLLKKETFFQLNRFYLLGSALSSVIIPFVDFNLAYTTDAIAMTDYMLPIITKAQTSHMSLVESVESPSPLIISVGDIIRLIYGLGVLIMTLKFLDAIFKVISMIGRGSKEKMGENTLVSHTSGVPSSSFFSYIFWNKNDDKKSSDVHTTIINHELVHVRQWHSLDVICMEILVILKWFNPLIYLFRKSLRLTHEYIADRYMAEQTDKLTYAHILINQNQGDSKLPLSNTFYSDIKERLQMMSQNSSSYWRLTKGLMIVPVFVGLLSLFSFNFTDHIPGIADGMEQINKAYDIIESTQVVSIDQTMVEGPLSSSMVGLTEEQQKNLIIFRWGSMMYNNDPKEMAGDGTIYYEDSVSKWSLRNSLKKKPMVFANNYYWYDYQFDITFQKGDESYTHNVKVDENYDGEKWADILSDIEPQKVVIENLSLLHEDRLLDVYFVYEVSEQNIKTPTVFQTYIYDGVLYDGSNFTNFGRTMTEIIPIKKEGLLELVQKRNWVNNLSDTTNLDLDNYHIQLVAKRDVVLDSTQLTEVLWQNPLIEREFFEYNYNSISHVEERLFYDYKSSNHHSVLKEWIQSLDDGDGMNVYLYSIEEFGSDVDSIKSVDGAVPVIYPYVLSEYNDLYEPNLKLSDKFSGKVEDSKYQIIYQAGDKTLVKLDRMNPDNEKILTAFSDASKFDIIHIPNYTTKHRVVEYKEDYFSADKKIIELSPGLDDIDVHRLPEFDGEENEIQLSWGQMYSFDNSNNFSLKQFHHNRKTNLKIKVNSEEYWVNRFTMYVIDKQDNIHAYQSTSTKAYELNKVLQNIHEESSIYIDDVIIDVDGEWQHVLERFSFVLE